MNRVSVIILCHDQAHMLARALYALGRQAEGLEDISLEIVIVDNGSRVPVDLDAVAPAFLAPLQRQHVHVVRLEASSMGFAVAHARNQGIAAATGEHLVFLDADCIPAPGLLRSYVEAMPAADGAVLIGHRYFVHGDAVSDARLLADLRHLYQVPQVPSDSNFGLVVDRRLPELVTLADHPMPFNCLHGCNFVVPAAAVRAVGGFDTEFDGAWGFEDIELGYRLHRLGLPFAYVPMAHVFHQDDRVPGVVNRHDVRNLHLAHGKIPGYAAYRPALRASVLFPA